MLSEKNEKKNDVATSEFSGEGRTVQAEPIESLDLEGVKSTTAVLSERLARGLASIDDAMCASALAEIERRVKVGEPLDRSVFLDEGPDPLGIDWTEAEKELALRAKGSKSD